MSNLQMFICAYMYATCLGHQALSRRLQIPKGDVEPLVRNS